MGVGIRARQCSRHISHLQLQSDVRNVTSLFFLRLLVFAFIECLFISFKYVCRKGYGHVALDRSVILWANAIPSAGAFVWHGSQSARPLVLSFKTTLAKPSGAHALSEDTELRPYECMVSASEGEEPRCQGGKPAAHPFHMDKEILLASFVVLRHGF